MSASALSELHAPLLCDACGHPLDAQPFDAFSLQDATRLGVGEVRVLARVVLPAQYCGLLQNFSQFTDRLVKNQEHDSPGLIWSLRMNGRPLAPYQEIGFIINPWGYGSFSVELRLDEGATVELTVRRTGDVGGITQVGGRIAGRSWYNDLYGGSTGTRAFSGRALEARRRP